jgi:hypothetical protein
MRISSSAHHRYGDRCQLDNPGLDNTTSYAHCVSRIHSCCHLAPYSKQDTDFDAIPHAQADANSNTASHTQHDTNADSHLHI